MTYLEQLRAEAKAAWNQACIADGIDPNGLFVVFTNTVEAAHYNELMGLYLKARRDAIRQQRTEAKRLERNRARRERHAALKSMGLKRVKGALGGVYYE